MGKFLYCQYMKKKDNYTCTICGGFTAYDQWSKPNVSCIDCGSED